MPTLAAVLALVCAVAAPRAGAAAQLQPVLAGLTSPLYVTHARDGTSRLFVVEQSGRIRVLQPGGGPPAVFLDITARVLSGGEQGLLGLAFHPSYAVNGRFFVNYTRQVDGATVIAEYRRSAADQNLAESAETVLLVIPQPFANHNGGMIEFGPDGLLYIGTGDGGSGNDPGNRAQDANELLGKVLRIDVDGAPGGAPYASPAGNPFAGAAPGRDEIFAVGLRNPFRFSFDRATGQLFLGDVGQGAREEIDLISGGGNYGWRVFEGTLCTGLDPAQCAAPGFTPPIAEYDHVGGRCSVTGGYVYRGVRGAVPAGAYLFADFCTGEVFQLLPAAPGGASTVILDTPLSVSSFGEDEAGEIYVVGLGGTVDRLTTTPPPPACSFELSEPGRTLPAAGGEATVTLVTAGDCAWLAASHVPWITITAGRNGTGAGAITFAVEASGEAAARTGTLHAGGQTLTVTQEAGVGDGPGAPAPGTGDGGNGGCFIATAAFGSPLAEEVETLRRFRDRHLLTSGAGRALVAAYYRLSPPIAEWLREHEGARAAVRTALRPLAWAVRLAMAAPGLVVVLAVGLALVAAGARRRGKLWSRGILAILALSATLALVRGAASGDTGGGPGAASAEVAFPSATRYAVISRPQPEVRQLVAPGERLAQPGDALPSIRVEQVGDESVLLQTPAGLRRIRVGQGIPGLAGARLAAVAQVRRIQYRYRRMARVGQARPVLASLREGTAVLEVAVPEPAPPAAAVTQPLAGAPRARLDERLLSRVEVEELGSGRYAVRRQDVRAVLEDAGRVLADLRPFVLPAFSLQKGVEYEITSSASDGRLGGQGFTVSSPKLARRAGIEPGDTILRVNGMPVDGLGSLYRIYQALRASPATASIEVELERAGARLTKVYRVR